MLVNIQRVGNINRYNTVGTSLGASGFIMFLHVTYAQTFNAYNNLYMRITGEETDKSRTRPGWSLRRHRIERAIQPGKKAIHGGMG